MNTSWFNKLEQINEVDEPNKKCSKKFGKKGEKKKKKHGGPI